MHAAAGEFSMVRLNVQYPSPFCENIKPGYARALLAELEATEGWIAALTDRALEVLQADMKIDAMLSVASELKEAREKRDEINRQLTDHIAEHTC
jgi:hypothetical protein